MDMINDEYEQNTFDDESTLVNIGTWIIYHYQNSGFKSAHHNSFENHALVDFIYRCLIFLWVADLTTWQATRRVSPAMQADNIYH